eukprot:1647095-Prymnesium_polylepis.1
MVQSAKTLKPKAIVRKSRRRRRRRCGRRRRRPLPLHPPCCCCGFAVDPEEQQAGDAQGDSQRSRHNHERAAEEQPGEEAGEYRRAEQRHRDSKPDLTGVAVTLTQHSTSGTSADERSEKPTSRP